MTVSTDLIAANRLLIVTEVEDITLMDYQQRSGYPNIRR